MKAEMHPLAGMHSTAEDASAALELGAECAHVVAPAPVVPWLPEGFEVQVIALRVDPVLDVYPLDLFEPGAGPDVVGLGRGALIELGKAAGISWEFSKRTDDGRHPHYVAWSAGLTYDRFDATPTQAIGSADLDYREPEIARLGAERSHAGPAYLELVAACDTNKRLDLQTELMRRRKLQIRAVETMAMNRAIGAMGVRRRYVRAELAKTFLIARPVFTGRSKDPETARRLAVLIAERHLHARGALYGDAAQ